MRPRRVVLCEGPEDLVALRELGQGLHGAQPQRAPPSSGPGGSERIAELASGSVKLKLVVAKNAKSGLKTAVLHELGIRPPRTKSDPNEERLTRLGVVFDPDEDPREVFEDDLLKHLAAHAKDWSVRPMKKPHRWLARRSDDGYRLVLHTLAWRAPSVMLDALPDWSNLERILCGVAALAYPSDAKLIERWLGEMDARARRHPWKAAVHLWCALVEPKGDEHSAPARFLHQNRDCAGHVSAVLGEDLLRELHALLAAP